MKWILASASPTRRRILENAGMECDVIPARIDEESVRRRHRRQEPAQIALILAREKARKVSKDHPRRRVLGADQILHSGSEILSKPGTLDEARKQLEMLRGGRHTLISALSLWLGEGEVWHHVDRADITMRDFSDAEVDSYLSRAGEDGMTTPGACRIEGPGIGLIERIEGDYFTILGLPLLPLLEVLRQGSGGT